MRAGLEGPLGPEAEPLQGLKPLNSGRNQSSLTALSLGERVAGSRRSHQPVPDG